MTLGEFTLPSPWTLWTPTIALSLFLFYLNLRNFLPWSFLSLKSQTSCLFPLTKSSTSAHASPCERKYTSKEKKIPTDDVSSSASLSDASDSKKLDRTTSYQKRDNFFHQISCLILFLVSPLSSFLAHLSREMLSKFHLIIHLSEFTLLILEPLVVSRNTWHVTSCFLCSSEVTKNSFARLAWSFDRMSFFLFCFFSFLPSPTRFSFRLFVPHPFSIYHVSSSSARV